MTDNAALIDLISAFKLKIAFCPGFLSLLLVYSKDAFT
jgi:hypothetical protein